MTTRAKTIKVIIALTVAAYEAYNKEAGGLTWDGKPIPKWDALPPNIKRRWYAAIMGATKESHAIDTRGSDPMFPLTPQEIEEGEA